MTIESRGPEHKWLKSGLSIITVISLGVAGVAAAKKHYVGTSLSRNADGAVTGLEVRGPFVPPTTTTTTIDMTDHGGMVRQLRESSKPWCSDVQITDKAGAKSVVCADMNSIRIGVGGKVKAVMQLLTPDTSTIPHDKTDLYSTFAANRPACERATAAIQTVFHNSLVDLGYVGKLQPDLELAVDSSFPGEGCMAICLYQQREQGNCPNPAATAVVGVGKHD